MLLAESDNASVEGRVLTMAKGVFAWMRQYPQMAKLTPVLIAACHSNNKSFVSIKETLDLGLQRLRGFLSRSKGISSKKLDDMTLSIHCQMFGTILYAITMDRISDLDLLEKSTLEMIRNFVLTGIKKDT